MLKRVLHSGEQEVFPWRVSLPVLCFLAKDFRSALRACLFSFTATLRLEVAIGMPREDRWHRHVGNVTFVAGAELAGYRI